MIRITARSRRTSAVLAYDGLGVGRHGVQQFEEVNGDSRLIRAGCCHLQCRRSPVDRCVVGRGSREFRCRARLLGRCPLELRGAVVHRRASRRA